ATGTARPWQAPQKRVEPICSQSLAAAHGLIENSQKPVLYIGGGVVLACAEQALRRFAAATGIPAVATLKGLGALDTDSPSFLGMLGMHGNAAANHAVQNSDLLIVAGARFDDRATGRLDGFAPNARVIHMDADSAEIGKLRPADMAPRGDLSSLLDGLSTARGRWHSWQAHCAQLKQRFKPRYDAPGTGVYAPALLRQLSLKAGEHAFVSCDVGQHQMWVAQHWRMTSGRNHLTSAGLGTMGYGLPAAMGAWLARPGRPVLCVSGDGSIMMNIQELATLRRYGIPVKIVLLDNAALGLVRQWQELFHAERYSEVDLSDNPDFTEVAQAFGIEAFSVSRRDEVDAALDRLLTAKGPALLHVKIDPRANVWPLVPPGHDNASMLGEQS
ncbi:MAG TPA: thiamine pyrophosphate-dependent enzyme, partial [Wenzhouxiangella sp.]|nr:thiamine pyrophosphate-dependent enzyme [Wenzhouxiangella sp.]